MHNRVLTKCALELFMMADAKRKTVRRSKSRDPTVVVQASIRRQPAITRLENTSLRSHGAIMTRNRYPCAGFSETIMTPVFNTPPHLLEPMPYFTTTITQAPTTCV